MVHFAVWSKPCWNRIFGGLHSGMALRSGRFEVLGGYVGAVVGLLIGFSMRSIAILGAGGLVGAFIGGYIGTRIKQNRQ